MIFRKPKQEKYVSNRKYDNTHIQLWIDRMKAENLTPKQLAPLEGIPLTYFYRLISDFKQGKR